MAAKISRASNTVVIEILSERRHRLKSISRELLIFPFNQVKRLQYIGDESVYKIRDSCDVRECVYKGPLQPET